MKSPLVRTALCALSLAAVLPGGRAAALTAQELLVVYNAGSDFSTRTAQEYAAKRGVPKENCVGLHGIKAADISRGDFERLVQLPLMAEATAQSWTYPANPGMRGRKRICAMVLMPDMPLRVGGEQGQGKSGASLDSELALLGARYPLQGGLVNPAFKKDIDISKDKPAVMAVCRIDGPDADCVNRMVNDPAAVEKSGGLWGWAVVDEGGPYKEGDAWFKAAADLAKVQGFPLFYETSRQTLAEAYPLMDGVAVYWGWYANPASGPFRPGAGDFRFAKGAVAHHLHSFSGTSVKDATRWVGALLKRGASVTAGNVAEPYLGGCINPEIFFARLLKGCTVAEASLMATPQVSWQGVVLGDPLYRPFAGLNSGRVPSGNPYAEWRGMCLAAAGNVKTLESQVVSRLRTPQGLFFMESFAWYCAEHGELDKAAEYFRMAVQAAKSPKDWTRCILMQVSVEYLRGEKKLAAELMNRVLEQTRTSPYRKAIEQTAATVLPKPETQKKK